MIEQASVDPGSLTWKRPDLPLSRPCNVAPPRARRGWRLLPSHVRSRRAAHAAAGAGSSGAETARRVSLLHFAYVTDIHILDAQSPGRFEFADRFFGHESLHLLIPAYRPHEFLQLHACETMLQR